ncbi:alpha-1,3-glucanase [Naviculisporaceae sp. PSN 640]
MVPFHSLHAILLASLSLLPILSVLAAKEVFAHVILGNTASLQASDWESDIALAQNASIDGFVLNVGFGDPNNDASLSRAFEAADKASNFSLFFSFDYLALGPWPKQDVINLLTEFGSRPSYFKQDGNKPVASTFEGPANAQDWVDIKAQTNCFFIPDWSSVPPTEAVSAAGGVADGLFNFNAWPVGATNITTDSDNDFLTALGEKKYMMPVSPWFYTALPGLNKNWMWRGDNLWEDRWQQVLEVQPEFVQILTWNDYGESHYIGPVRELPAQQLMHAGGAPVDYVTGLEHDGWRKLLPFYIGLYKSAAAPAVEESVVAYYRTNPGTACSSGGTTGNNPAFGQTELPPDQMVEDSVFFTALLNSPADDVQVSIGGNKDAQTAEFLSKPQSEGAGIYTGKVAFAGRTGEVIVSVLRGGSVVAEAKGGKEISGDCAAVNWNAVAISS